MTGPHVNLFALVNTPVVRLGPCVDLWWWGPSWGGTVCDPARHVQVPDAECATCGEPFIEGRSGICVVEHGDAEMLRVDLECLRHTLFGIGI